MPHWLESLGLYLRPPDLRSRREVDDEIRAELEFHVEMRARDLERTGLAPEDARCEAERRFGDRARVEKACRQAQIGERIMLQRIQALLLLALLGAVGWLAWRSYAREEASAAAFEAMADQLASVRVALDSKNSSADAAADRPRTRDMLIEDSVRERANRELQTPGSSAPGHSPRVVPSVKTESDLDEAERDSLARLNGTDDWRASYNVGNEIAEHLAPEDSLRLMRAIWPRIESPEHRRQILKGFVFRRFHPVALPVLHLAATDPDTTVQTVAFHYLRSYAFRDFATDFEAYQRWYDQWGAQPIGEVVAANARLLAERMAQVDPAAVSVDDLLPSNILRKSRDGDDGLDVAAVLREAGLIDTILGWIERGDRTVHEAAVDWLAAVPPDFETVKKWLQGEMHYQWIAIQLLGRSTYPFRESDLAWMLEDSGSRGTERIAFSSLSRQPRSEAFLQEHVLPRLGPEGRIAVEHPGDETELIKTLGASKAPCSFDALVGQLGRSPQSALRLETVGSAFGELGDARAIPHLIGAVESIREGSELEFGRQRLIEGGLQKLTGVATIASRNFGFWRRWWDDNRRRYPADVQEIAIPRFEWKEE